MTRLVSADSLVSIVLQDQLLQPQECPFVRDLLPDLHTRFPSVLCRQSRTRRALASVDDEGEDECLLQNGIGQDFFLNRDLDLDSSRMGFCPDVRCVDKSDFL
jgi:hypothetical protein